MRGLWTVALLNVVALVTGGSAVACVAQVRMELDDIRYADVVVVGRVANYDVVADPVARQRREELIASSPKWREILKGREDTRLFSDYARFDVLVDEVLRGNAPKILAVTWADSTFPEPKDVAVGAFLIALRKPSSPMPPLRGPSAAVLPNPTPDILTVLQAPCAGAFMFKSTSKEAGLVRDLLGSGPK